MDRYVLVNVEGLVTDSVLWDGSDAWSPPDGYSAVRSDVANHGWIQQSDGSLIAQSIEVPAPSAVELDAQARAWRDGEIASSQWLVQRYRDQLDLGGDTSLTAAQFTALLTYRQALRDWPAAADFPTESGRPVAPAFLAGQVQ